jgi:4-hydroxybenzoate polyprenyltransferase
MPRPTTNPRAVLTDAILFLVHSNLLISLSATSVALSTMLLADLAVDPAALFIVFAVTLFVYSFNRLTDIAEDERNVPDRASFVRQYGVWLLAIGALLYLAATAVALVRGIPGAPAMIVPLGVAVLYSVVGLKRILLVKNLLVGLSWGLIPLGVGVYYGVLRSVDILFMFGFITAALTIAAVVFDIKDIAGDRAEGIRSVPVVAGPARTRQFAVAASAVLGAIVVLLLFVDVLHRQYVLLLPFVCYMIGYSLVARRDRTPLFYGFVIDSEHIFLALSLVCWEVLV